MHRTFNLQIPADNNYHNLYSLIVGNVYGSINGGTDETGVTGATPTDGIFPDRIQQLNMIPDPTNVSDVLLSDRNFANSPGLALQNLTQRSNRNTICLKDYFVKGNNQKVIVDLESM